MGLATIGCLVLLAGAATTSAATPAAAHIEQWNGVWERFKVGASGFPEDPGELAEFAAAVRAVPPYNAEWLARFRAVETKALAAPPYSACENPNQRVGFPGSMLLSVGLFQLLTAQQEFALFFYPDGVRHIDFGRPHPPADEIWPSAMGDSIGRWEGQTLVVDTVGSNAPILVVLKSRVPAPFSDQIHVIERLRLVDANTLENDMVIEDPVALAQPWKMKIRYNRVKGLRHIIEHDCAADRNPVVDGEFTIAPAPVPRK